MKKRTLLAVCTAITSIVAIGCATMTSCDGGVLGNNSSSTQTTVSISQESAQLIVGETLRLTAAVSDGSDTEWTTSDQNVATVRNGVVTAKGVGTATITVTAGGVSATCTITVEQGILTLSAESAQVERGETYTLTATAKKADGTPLTGDITWSSSDESIATVQGGVVTAKKEGTVTITAKYGYALATTCEVTVSWANKPADYAEISFGTEDEATANVGKYLYWNDQGWCGSNVSVSQAEYMNGGATFAYSGSSAVWYGMQVFYKKETNEAGKNYQLTANISSAKECDITINGTVVHLNQGENPVTVYAQESAKSSLSLQMGVNGGAIVEENTITISNLQFVEFTPEQLETPSAIAIENGVLTITDGNEGKADSYQLSFNQNGESVYKVTAQNGEAVDTSYMEDGTYQVTVVAVGSGKYQTSAESAALLEYTVNNGGVQYELSVAEEPEAVANPGKFYYWTEFGGITDAKYESGTLSFNVVNGGNWYSNQIFFKNSTLTAGSRYTLTFALHSTKAGTVTINGTKVELQEGDNQISVRYTETGDGASFSMQIGWYIDENVGGVDITDATITITDIQFKSGVGVSATGMSEGVEADAIASPGNYFYYQQWEGLIDNASYADGTLQFELLKNGNWYSAQIFYKDANLEAGKYRLTFNLNSTVAGSIRINGQNTDIQAGDNAISIDYDQASGASLSIQMGIFNPETNEGTVTIDSGVFTITNIHYELIAAADPESAKQGGAADANANPDKMYYWNDNSVTINAAVDNNDGFTLNYSGLTEKCWYGVQVFYSNSENVVGETYKVSFNIVSEVEGNITVNGKVVSLTKGSQSVEVTYIESTADEYGNVLSSLNIQMGVASDNTVIASNIVRIYDLTFTKAETAEGDKGEQGNQGGEQGEVTDAAEVTLEFVEIYGANDYMTFHTSSEAELSTAAHVKVNGTQVWSESIQDALGTFKVYVGDSTLTEYTFEWVNAEGKVFAKGVYTPAQSGDNGNNGEQGGGEQGGDQGEVTEVTEVALIYQKSYGDYYMTFDYGTADFSAASYVKVNGTQQWLEYLNNTTLFNVYVGDLTLSEYTFEWVNAEGKVFAKGVYTPAQSGDNGDNGEQGGEVTEVAEVKLEFVEIYGANDYMTFHTSSTADLSTAAHVKVNGTQRWSESIKDAVGTFKVYVGDSTLTEYTFEWVNASGNVFAKGVYTPAQSGDNSGDNSNNGEQGSEGNGEQGNQGEQNGVTNLEFRGEKPNAQQGTVGAVDDPGTYYYWNDQGWCGSYVTVNQAVIDAEGAVTLDYAYQYGGTWYGMQLFYEDPNTETGKKYTLSLHIDSEYDCNITINGKVIVLSAGANEVTLEYVETDDASLSIQMGVADRSYMEKNTLKIYDVTFTEVKETINESSDGDMEAGENGSEEIGENSSIGD